MDRTAQWHGVGVTDVGHVRPTNQDAFRVSDELGLWMVADGMGGHAGGDIASQKAVEAIHGYVKAHHPFKTEEIPALLQSAVSHANDAIRDYASAHPAFIGMGTTVVVLFIPPPLSDCAWIAHAGDSRAYLIREQHLSALTTDHTVLEERIQAGLLPRSTPAHHELGHALTRAVGVESSIKTDVSKIKLQPMDAFLLCSDGLNKMLEDARILDTLMTMTNHPPARKCEALVNLANDRGGRDNTTVVLIYNENAGSQDCEEREPEPRKRVGKPK